MFTFSCCHSVGVMVFVPPSLILIKIILFILANFSYEAGQPFYNALLYSVADGSRARFVSGVGVALGYVGSILGMILVLPFVTGSVYSWNIAFMDAGGKRASFLPTALLFMLFALPLFLWVKEAGVPRPQKVGLAESYRAVWSGVRGTRKYPGVLRFLIADYFFEDAVATVIINIGLYCSIVLGLAEQAITTFLIISTVSAVVGSFVIGKIAQYWSLKKLLNLIVWGWVAVLILFVVTDSMTVIWILGSLVGILLGGLWTTTRPMLAELVPREDLGRFFGLFAVSGRAAAVVGPLVWTAVVYFFHSDRILGKATVGLLGAGVVEADKLPYKIGILSLTGMMVIGLYIFRKVPPGRERNYA